MSRFRSLLWLLSCTAVMSIACGDEETATGADGGGFGDSRDAAASDAGVVFSEAVQVDVESPPPQRLSAFRFFRYLGGGRFEYNVGVVPYELTTPLFSDFARKARAIYVPPGEGVSYSSKGVLELPVGSAIVKTFLIADDLTNPESPVTIVETRVLIREAEDWRPYPYVWRDDASDADLVLGGRTRSYAFVDPYGSARTARYLIPSRNQCFECHETVDGQNNDRTTPIGTQVRYLNRDNTYDGRTVNQLRHLEAIGLLTGLPPIEEVESAFSLSGMTPSSIPSMDAATIERAARDYLDINCAHCHSPSAREGITSQFFLNYDNSDLFRLGVCKRPGSAGSGTGGRLFDIVPGDPDSSILIYRTETEVVGDMMPLIGRSLADDVGVALVRSWVANMPTQACQ